jgi:phosphoglycerate dehydrogenase-like enzyme
MASRADFVISTVVLDQETRGMFSKPLFDVMKPSAFVINASRGPVVNERDLIEALQKRKIAGAGLDVFNDEPLDPASPLLTMENVFATPHVGGATRQNVEAVGKIVADNIRRLEQGRPLLYCVNLNDLPR